MDAAGNSDEKHDQQICHVQCYTMGLTSRYVELYFSNYLQHKTKINEQLCSGERKWARASQILWISLPLTIKWERIKLATELATSHLSSACKALYSPRKTWSSAKLRLHSSQTEDIPTVFPELFCKSLLTPVYIHWNWTKYIQGLVNT